MHKKQCARSRAEKIFVSVQYIFQYRSYSNEGMKRLFEISGKYLVPVMAGLVSLVLRFRSFRIPYLLATESPVVPGRLRDQLVRARWLAMQSHPNLSKVFRTGKALIIYYSVTGNTEKVALAVQRGVRKAGLKPTTKKISEAYEEELFHYDLVCFGTPALHAFVPSPVNRFIRKRSREYGARSRIEIPAAEIPGKNALVFVTFSGPHIGLDEASPAGKYVKSFFRHLGFDVKGEWYIVGEFHGLGKLGKVLSVRGFLGDIRGRPNTEDLASIEEKTIKLVNMIKAHI